MRVRGIRCPYCWSHIWSRSIHNLRYCFCGYCFIDGGRHYLRWGYGWGDGTPDTELPTQVEINTEERVE